VAKLLAFLPCEKVLIDGETQQVSLISVLGGVHVGVAPDSPIPIGAFTPMRWTVFTLWQTETGDADSFEQMVSFLDEDGQCLSLVGPFSVAVTGPQSKTINRFESFPIWRPGMCVLRLQRREAGAEEWQTVLDHRIEVKHLPISPASESAA